MKENKKEESAKAVFFSRFYEGVVMPERPYIDDYTNSNFIAYFNEALKFITAERVEAYEMEKEYQALAAAVERFNTFWKTYKSDEKNDVVSELRAETTAAYISVREKINGVLIFGRITADIPPILNETTTDLNKITIAYNKTISQ